MDSNCMTLFGPAHEILVPLSEPAQMSRLARVFAAHIHKSQMQTCVNVL